jgi:hypothetical protein
MKLDLTKLKLDNIVEMLEARGYNETSTDIYAVEYVSTKNGQVKYKIKFDNDGIGDTGYVYVFIDDNGQLACDY